LAVEVRGEGGTHLRPDAVYMPGRFATCGGGDAESAKFLADEGLVAFTVTLPIGQNAVTEGQVTRALEQNPGAALIVAGATSGPLGKHELSWQSSNDHPFAPVAPGQSLTVIAHTVDQKGTDRSGSQARPLHRDRCSLLWRRRHAAYGLVQQTLQVGC